VNKDYGVVEVIQGKIVCVYCIRLLIIIIIIIIIIITAFV